MKNEEFRYWLNGFLTLEKPEVILTTKQLKIILNHLNLVQTVMGSLDEHNQWLKNEITRVLAESINDSNERKRLTSAIRQCFG